MAIGGGRHAIRELTKMAADGLDRQMEHPGDYRGKHHGNQHSRPVWQQASQQEDQGGGACANSECGRAEGRQRLTEHRELGQQLSRFGTGQFQAAEILKLACKDRDCNPAGEADGYGMRNMEYNE